MTEDYKIEQMHVDDNAINEVRDLLHLCFENRESKFSTEYLTWQYRDNPHGHLIAFNAYAADGQLAAHYATIPIEMTFGDKIVPGVLSLNTATHPDHRGKRLFSLLADSTYRRAQELGYKYVIGVANANSTHGFLKNLGFYLIAPLEVKIGLGVPFVDDITTNKNRVFYDLETLNWRLKCPYYSYKRSGDFIYGSLDKPLFSTAVAQIPSSISSDAVNIPKNNGLFHLWIGLGVTTRRTYMRLPKFIKRSPFNLIFRDLTDGELPKLTPDNIVFQLLDFDVA